MYKIWQRSSFSTHCIKCALNEMRNITWKQKRNLWKWDRPNIHSFQIPEQTSLKSPMHFRNIKTTKYRKSQTKKKSLLLAGGGWSDDRRRLGDLAGALDKGPVGGEGREGGVDGGAAADVPLLVLLGPGLHVVLGGLLLRPGGALHHQPRRRRRCPDEDAELGGGGGEAGWGREKGGDGEGRHRHGRRRAATLCRSFTVLPSTSG